jgi:hypothetical protein
MPEPVGSFIDGGESAASGNHGNPGTAGSGNQEPEILNGFEAYEPDTERITERPRVTKRGTVDRRTKAGRAGSGGSPDSPGPDASKVHISKLDLGEVLFSIHLTLAELTGVPELEIDKGEAKDLGEAVKDFSKFYGIAFDPKKVALFNLCVAMGKVYIPRAVAIKNRMSQQKGPAPVKEMPRREKPVNMSQAPPPPAPISLAGMAPSDIWQEPMAGSS